MSSHVLRMRWLAVLWVALWSATAYAGDDVHGRAEALARQKRFAEAETEYRNALRTDPRDYRLRLGLARVILWSGRHHEAERHFAALVSQRERDVNALLGYAQAAYWSGDFRAAQRRFNRVIERDPSNAEARRSLDELRAVAESRYELSAHAGDDSQPLRRFGGEGRVSLFSDPLTRWDFRWNAASLDATDVRGTVRSIGFGVESAFPRKKITVAANAAFARFPDDHDGIIGGVSVGYRRFVAAIERTPLLGTASSLDTHTTATLYRLSWSTKDDARWLAAGGLHSIDYSDGNRGKGVDGYVLVPAGNGFRAGVSAAWRDTDQNRFRFTGFRSERVDAQLFRYEFSGVYDPYWTPHRLREARVIAAADRVVRRARIKVQADFGYARDQYLSFSPPTGATPTPVFTFPLMLDRSFRPWRASVEAAVPISASIEVRGRYRHDVTAFYRANEIQASVGGRF